MGVDTLFPVMIITAAATTSSFQVHAIAPGLVAENQRRSISPAAGHALEMLGHAIETLPMNLSATQKPWRLTIRKWRRSNY